MGSHNFGSPTDSCQRTSDHLMGNCMRKYDQKIRRSDPAFHVCAGLAEHFGFTSVFPADIRILSFHAFIPAKNHNTHKNLLLKLVSSNLVGHKTRRTEARRLVLSNILQSICCFVKRKSHDTFQLCKPMILFNCFESMDIISWCQVKTLYRRSSMYNHQLDTFIKTADLGSFGKAGEALYISSTAVIQQINLLENLCGFKLFVRSNHGVKLTVK